MQPRIVAAAARRQLQAQPLSGDSCVPRQQPPTSQRPTTPHTPAAHSLLLQDAHVRPALAKGVLLDGCVDADLGEVGAAPPRGPSPGGNHLQPGGQGA